MITFFYRILLITILSGSMITQSFAQTAAPAAVPAPAVSGAVAAALAGSPTNTKSKAAIDAEAAQIKARNGLTQVDENAGENLKKILSTQGLTDDLSVANARTYGQTGENAGHQQALTGDQLREKAEIDKAYNADMTMVVVGSISTRLPACTPTNIIDMTTATIAGAAFAAGEQDTASKLVVAKNELDALLQDTLLQDRSGDPSGKQMRALELLKASYLVIQNISIEKQTVRETARNAYYQAAVEATQAQVAITQAVGQCQANIINTTNKWKSDATAFQTAAVAACALGCAGWGAWACYLGCVAAYAYVDSKISDCEGGSSDSVGNNNNRGMSCKDMNSSAHIHANSTSYPPPLPATISGNISNSCNNLGPGVPSPASSRCSGVPTVSLGGFPACDQANAMIASKTVTCGGHTLDGKSEHDRQFFTAKPVKNYLEIVSNILFSPVQAMTLTAMRITNPAVQTYLSNQSVTFANALDTQLASPLWRSIAWTSLGDTVNAAMQTGVAMQAQIQADIDKIQSIINALKNAGANGSTAGVAAIATATGLNAFGSSTNNTAISATFSALPCIPGTGSGNCSASNTGIMNSPGFLELPGSVQGNAANALRIGAGLSGATSLSPGLLASMSAFNASGNAIRADLLQRQQSLQKMMGLSGTKVDMAKEVAKFSGQLAGVTKDALVAGNMSAQQMKSLMSGGSSALGSKSDAQNSLNKLNSKIAAGGGGGNMNGIGGSHAAAAPTEVASGKNALSSEGLSTAEKAVFDTLTDAQKAAFLAMSAEERAAFMAMSPAERAAFLAMSADERAAFMSMSPAERAAFLAMTSAERAAFMTMTPEERAAFMAMNAAERAAYMLARAKLKNDVNEDNGYSLFEVITKRYQKSAYPKLFKKAKE
jgi:hypothetical protein